LSKDFNKDITINSIKKFFWEEGTHYYKPLIGYKSRKEFIKEAQHPKNNIWVVGEVVAERQGWVEGALSSVEKISLFKK
jgi:monoamine oxidase